MCGVRFLLSRSSRWNSRCKSRRGAGQVQWRDANDLPQLRVSPLACSTYLSKQQQTCRSTDPHLLVLDVLSIMKELKQALGIRACFLGITYGGVQISNSYTLSCWFSKKQHEINFHLSQTKDVFGFVFFWSPGLVKPLILLLWCIHAYLCALEGNSSNLAA